MLARSRSLNDANLISSSSLSSFDIPVSGPQSEAPAIAAAAAAKRPYYGKCQYKTGKCFHERTLKRNGEIHSLCEEHRIKQNLIQRRSDRKYQSVHAMRRRERSQRRAALKKQVSMAVAQQLFFEHQQQQHLGLHIGIPSTSSPVPEYTQSAPALGTSDYSHFLRNPFVTAAESLRVGAGGKIDEDSSPTSIDDFSPDSFLAISEKDGDALYSDIAPITYSLGEKHSWTEEDVAFLQSAFLG
jgi:hypothetical protein